jgi:hypothetical protein
MRLSGMARVCHRYYCTPRAERGGVGSASWTDPMADVKPFTYGTHSMRGMVREWR